MVMNLIAGGLGTGLFSLPWSMAGASVLVGIAMTVGVVLVNALTIMILVHAAEEHKVFDLGNLLGLLPGRLGRLMRVLTNVVVWLVLLGVLVSYVIVIHDSARPFVRGTSLDRGRLPVILLAALVVLPLSFLRQRYLSWTSSVAALVNAYLVALFCARFWAEARSQRLPEGSCMYGFSNGSFAMIGNLATCIIIQMCVLPMYEELEGRTPARFCRILACAFTVLVVIFCCFATFGYLTFGPDVQPNALTDLPHGIFNGVAKVGTLCVVAAIYPIMVIPMVAPIRNLSPTVFAPPGAPVRVVERTKQAAVAGAKVLIALLCCAGALFIEDLSFVNVIGGAVSVGVFTAWGPAAVGLYLLGRRSLAWRCAMHVLLLAGAVLAVMGLVLNKNYKEQLAASCRWSL